MPASARRRNTGVRIVLLVRNDASGAANMLVSGASGAANQRDSIEALRHDEL